MFSFPNVSAKYLRLSAYRPSAFLRWLSLPSAYPYNPTLIFSLSVGGWRGGSRYPFPCGEERGGFLLVEIDRQFFDEMINRFNNNNIKIDRI